MSADLASILEDSLERLAQGETLQACLARYPEQATELEQLLSAAARLGNAVQVRPSATFKARARVQLHAHMAVHPRQRRTIMPRFSPLFRLTLGLASLLLAFAITGTALAQSALPGEFLYPWKLTSEHVWRSISPDQVGVDLVLAERRVDEALAVSDNSPAQGVALHGYQKVVTDLTQNNDSSAQERIQTGLKVQQEKLKNAGLEPPIVIDQNPELPSVSPIKPNLTPISNPKDSIPPVSNPDSKKPPVIIVDPTAEIPPLPNPLH